MADLLHRILDEIRALRAEVAELLREVRALRREVDNDDTIDRDDARPH